MRRWIATFALILTGCAAVSAAPALNTSSGAPSVRSVHVGLVSALESRPSVPRARKSATTNAHRSTHAPAGAAAPRSPTPPSTPNLPPPIRGGCARGYVHDLIVRFFGSQAAHALYVAERESHCNPRAWNPRRLRLGHASGVAQILAPGNWNPWSRSCGYGGASVFSAYANVGTWACIVHRYGWGPWGG